MEYNTRLEQGHARLCSESEMLRARCDRIVRESGERAARLQAVQDTRKVWKQSCSVCFPVGNTEN
jgi:hypothetical protein